MENTKKTLTPFERLVDFIEHYESDTFSADKREVTHKEAEVIAERLIVEMIEDEIDGVTLSGILLDLRPEESDEDDEEQEQ